MLTKTNPNSVSEKIIRRLVAQAKEGEENGAASSDARFSLFRPVSILINRQCIAAFCREISTSSIGLLHEAELPLDEVEMSIPIEPHRLARLRIQIEECQPCGEGWYESTGRFVRSGDNDQLPMRFRTLERQR